MADRASRQPKLAWYHIRLSVFLPAIMLAAVCWGPVLSGYHRSRLQQPVIRELRKRGARVDMRWSYLTPAVADFVALKPYNPGGRVYQWTDEDMKLVGKLDTLRDVAIDYSEVTDRGLVYLRGCRQIEWFSA